MTVPRSCPLELNASFPTLVQVPKEYMNSLKEPGPLSTFFSTFFLGSLGVRFLSSPSHSPPLKLAFSQADQTSLRDHLVFIGVAYRRLQHRHVDRELRGQEDRPERSRPRPTQERVPTVQDRSAEEGAGGHGGREDERDRCAVFVVAEG
jgi:hypothetical protein